MPGQPPTPPPVVIPNAPNSPNAARQPCSTTYGPEARTSFADMLKLLADAEAALTKNGITTVKDQIRALRGIYYGTTWSVDYLGLPGSPGERSVTRSAGFNHFTRPSVSDVASTTPPDIRPFLCCGLFEALYNNQDWSDAATGRKLDFGHLLIGLDARFDSTALTGNVSYAVNVALGFTKNVDMGGTGFEVVTWLGDMGGGTGSLGVQRGVSGTLDPNTIKTTVFANTPPHDSDYGGWINLEGDVAAGVVGNGGATTLAAPTFDPGKHLSDAMQDYLAPGSAAWSSRAATFLKVHGGTLDGTGALTNRAVLVSQLATKIAAFSCNYLASRVKDKDVTLDQGKAAAFHVVGAASEVAGVFVDTLVAAQAPGVKVTAYNAGVTFPAPTARATSQSCTEQITFAGMASWLPF